MSLRLKPSSAILASPFFRFQTVELRLWSIQQDAGTVERQASLLVMENHFRFGRIGASGIADIDLYSNRWILVNNITISAGGDIYSNV